MIYLCDSTPGLDMNRNSSLKSHVWIELQINQFHFILIENKIPSHGLNLTIKTICDFTSLYIFTSISSGLNCIIAFGEKSTTTIISLEISRSRYKYSSPISLWAGQLSSTRTHLRSEKNIPICLPKIQSSPTGKVTLPETWEFQLMWIR